MDINATFRELAQYRLMLEETKKEVEKLEAEIKAYMVAEHMQDLIGDEHKAHYIFYEEMRFDSKAFKKDHADMYEMYRKPNQKSKFTFA